MKKHIQQLALGLAPILILCACAVSIVQPAAFAATAAPASLESLGLQGHLVYQSSIQNGSAISMNIDTLDLATGNSTIIFHAPDGGWIDSIGVSPDGQEVVMAYAPPPVDNNAMYTSPQDLYVLPADGSAGPKLLFTPPVGRYQYLEPTWSPDGKVLFFCRLDYSTGSLLSGQMGTYEIERMNYPGGIPQKVVENAYWPRLSLDGARLAYVATDASNQSNQLWISRPDGSNAAPVRLAGGFISSIIDAPLFSADGRTIFYSGTIPQWPAQPDLADKLLGITLASAHAVPSDWWSVSSRGGQPVRLTHLSAQGLYGSLSPDGKLLTSYSNNGIFLMRPDGTGLTLLIQDTGGLAGMVNWTP